VNLANCDSSELAKSLADGCGACQLECDGVGYQIFLGLLIYTYYKEGTFGIMAGVGVLIMLASLILVALTQRFARGRVIG
jgi:hypothetical protein